MSTTKAVLFDADGVLVVPQKLFAVQYAEENGIDPSVLQKFFAEVFPEASEGRADLVDLIRENYDVWQWDRDPQELLDMWFATENVINQEALEVVRTLKKQGTPVYMATVQEEEHRAKYLKEVMFPNTFKRFFVSHELGYMKKDKRFWDQVLEQLAVDIPGIKPQEILFFDDSQDSLDGALQAGINAHLYKTVEQMKSVLHGT